MGDYFCIPQCGPLELPPEGRLAMESIANYIVSCTYLFVLAPPLAHKDVDRVCSKISWNTRGWCRVEQAAFMMASVSPQVYVVLNENMIEASVPFNWTVEAPSAGSVTVDADRVRIACLTMAMIEYQMLGYRRSKATLFDFRRLKALRPQFTNQMNEAPSLDAWLQAFMFSSAKDDGAPEKWTPLCFAALEGNHKIMSELVTAGASPDGNGTAQVGRA